MQTERRNHVRYVSQENVFAALGDRYTKVGKIIDISMGGLSFEYIIGQENSEVSSTVDVFLTDASFHIHNLPCTVIYDVEAGASVAGNQSVDMLRRRCAVLFIKRSDEHKREVRSLIKKHTIGGAEDSSTP
jgi:hypothetical protein